MSACLRTPNIAFAENRFEIDCRKIELIKMLRGDHLYTMASGGNMLLGEREALALLHKGAGPCVRSAGVG